MVSVKANLVENLGNSVAGEHPTEELKKILKSNYIFHAVINV